MKATLSSSIFIFCNKVRLVNASYSHDNFVQLKARLLRTVRMSRGPTSIVRSTTAPLCFDSKPRICQRSHFWGPEGQKQPEYGTNLWFCWTPIWPFTNQPNNFNALSHCCNMSATTCLPGISEHVENTTARWCVVCGKGANIGQHTSCVPVYALALLTLLPWIISLPSSHKTKYYNLVPPNIQGGHIWQVSTHGPSVHNTNNYWKKAL